MAEKRALFQEGREAWLNFINWVELNISYYPYFRGHQDKEHSKGILPRIGRKGIVEHYSLAQEQELFAAFKRDARRLEKGVGFSEWDWLTLGQQCGLPTRFLDWTTSPFIALYFAVNDDPHKDGEVLAIRVHRDSVRNCEDLGHGPFEISDDVIFVRPSATISRIQAQRSAFTVHRYPNEPFKLPKKTTKTRNARKVVQGSVRFPVEADLKSEFRLRLFQMGFDYDFVGRDLDGIGRTLAWRIQNRQRL